MKFICLQENLAAAIGAVGNVAQKSGGLPVLRNIHLKTEEGVLNLRATNLEVGVHHKLRGKIDRDGECLVDAKLLTDLVPLLPSGQVELTLEDDGLHVTTLGNNTVLRVSPTSEFPVIPQGDTSSESLSLSHEILSQLIERTSFAAGRVQDRPQFNGVLLLVDGKILTLVATDGYRLAEVGTTLEEPFPQKKVIVPLSTIQELQKTLSFGDQASSITIYFEDSQLFIIHGGTSITSRLVEGEYPDYLPLFPKQQECIRRVDTSDFIRAVKATTIFSRTGIADVTLVGEQDGSLVVSAENSDRGANKTTVEAIGSGVVAPVVLNARYLIDGLQALSGLPATLTFSGPDRPVLLEPTNEDQTHYRYLIMPIRQ